MQTAVDCNGSSSNSTTITTTQTETGNDATMTQHVLVVQSPTTDHAEAPTTVLRHRMTAATNNSYGAMKGPKNGLTHLIDATEYLGSNVECMAVTPSPSPQASPSKRDKCKVAETLDLVGSSLEKCKTNTSSSPSPSPESCSSKTTSNSTSTTSSVIATPISKRNGNVFKDMDMEDNTKPSAQADTAAAAVGNGGAADGVATSKVGSVAAGAAAATFRECSKQQQQEQLKQNQMLPFENTSSIANKQELSSGPSLVATMSSSTTSSSINSNASNASSATSSSSSSSITPASATTPALLSPSSTATSTASSSPASLNTPATPPPSTKAFSISGDAVDADLLQWQDMPQYLQFNPYVLKGYRPLQTFKGCLLSLFYWHNETINILTHGK